jgi:hypothetical protein
VPFAIVTVGAPESTIDVSVGVTVRAAVPVTEPTLAVIAVVPGPTAVANPPAAMVATVSTEDAHVAVVVRT